MNIQARDSKIAFVKTIVLDFDGVIVESNSIKHQSFSKIFSEYPEYYESIMSYHYAHNAVNRHEKFRHIIEKIMGREYDKELAGTWANQFSLLTREKIIECPEVKGSLEFIKHFKGKYPLYIASATPSDELELILDGRGYRGYFKNIYGAPTRKKEMLLDIAKREQIKPIEVLYIGDSREDFEVADEFGCTFIARICDFDFKEYPIPSFKDMAEIKSYVMNNLE